MSRPISTICLCLALLVGLFDEPARSQQQKDQSHIKALAFFAGNWTCEGKFSSGKTISAKLHYELILDGSFMLFRHDDLPPHAYHAWAEWGWDPAGDQFIGVYEDSTGSLRVFRSSGWRNGVLQWIGGSLPDAKDQQFEFERTGDKQFRVSYSYKKDGSWRAVDSSVCSSL